MTRGSARREARTASFYTNAATIENGSPLHIIKASLPQKHFRAHTKSPISHKTDGTFSEKFSSSTRNINHYCAYK